jgi:hypothetical protein
MIDPTHFILSSLNNTFKNYSSTTGIISVPSTSYAAGTYKTYSTTIDMDTNDSSIQVLQNFSYDSSKWYVGSFIQTSPDANFSAQTRIKITGGTMSVDCYVINQTGGTVSNPEFTLTIEVRRFLGPFE